MNKPKNHNRANDQTAISISLPKRLKARLKARCKAAGLPSLSYMIRLGLESLESNNWRSG